MGLIDFSLSDIGNVITGIREAITGEKIKDPVEMAKVQLQLEELDKAIQKGQLSINREEARNPNIFVAGWRPFIGWVGGISLTYQFVIYPLMIWAWALWGPSDVTAPPPLDASVLFTIVISMLGVGTMRSYDKLKGTDTKNL